MTVTELIRTVDRPEGALDLLSSSAAIVIPRYFDAERCATWTKGVYEAREEWTQDFDGEQFSLGRAFYTHLETGKSKSYFEDTTSSDARVERHAPGLQAAMFELVRSIVKSKHVVQRRGWCGPGVHVFPTNGPVAERGGVQHFDTEGLTARHIEQHRPAITVVAMLQPTEAELECGLRVWDVLYSGSDDPTEDELTKPNDVAIYRVGDIVLIDSYRLHQILPFKGTRERISATIHAAQSDTRVWECWF
jgi:hypothetical protein